MKSVSFYDRIAGLFKVVIRKFYTTHPGRGSWESRVMLRVLVLRRFKVVRCEIVKKFAEVIGRCGMLNVGCLTWSKCEEILKSPRSSTICQPTFMLEKLVLHLLPPHFLIAISHRFPINTPHITYRSLLLPPNAMDVNPKRPTISLITIIIIMFLIEINSTSFQIFEPNSNCLVFWVCERECRSII